MKSKEKTLELLENAKKEGYAIGAFNAANIETLKAITGAAKNLNSPVILESSEGEINYVGLKQMVSLVNVYKEELEIPIILNLDHSKSFEACKNAIDAGFDYVHIDGSELDFDNNVELTKKVVEYAHSHGVVVEGEMDHIQGSSADHTDEDPSLYEKPEYYTDPEKAGEFVSQTEIDVFAGFIGNLHGIYSKEIRLKFEILEKLKNVLPNTFFSLHGGSGINEEDVKKAISMGIVKVNVNSEMRLVFKNALRETLKETEEIAIYKITPQAIEAVEKVIEKKIRLFGSEQKAVNTPYKINSIH